MSYCNWSKACDITRKYHDEEWGVPLHNDRGQFEFLMLEVMQCGLSWDTVMKKREILSACFDNFDFEKVAQYNEMDVDRIMNTPGMIRSPRKITAVINNAKNFCKIRDEFGTFDAYLWNFSNNKTILYDGHERGFIPVSNALSDTISCDLKKRDFKFIGSITVYSHLQACGIINDHDESCPRYAYINDNFPTCRKPVEGEVGVKEFRK